jgi:hypothetical protein
MINRYIEDSLLGGITDDFCKKSEEGWPLYNKETKKLYAPWSLNTIYVLQDNNALRIRLKNHKNIKIL